jgi:hypothetical protein
MSEDYVYDYTLGIEKKTQYAGVIRVEMPKYHMGTKYAILYCQNCDHHLIVKDTTAGTGWHSVYPIPSKHVSEDIPQPIGSEFKEASLCFAVGAYMACAAMCQRVLESICQNKNVSGLNKLHEDGIISKNLFEKATEIRLWAGIIKHKPISESVSKEDADKLLTYLDVILDDVYVEPQRLASLGEKRKRMKKKPAP